MHAVTTIEPPSSEQQLPDIRYYFVWPTRRRRPFLDGAILQRTVELLAEAALAIGARVVTVSTGGDYLIVTVEAHPALSPNTIVSHLKRQSAGKLRREFPELLRLPSVWTRKFLATTRDDYPPERIRSFIEEQPRSERRRYPRTGELDSEPSVETVETDIEVRRLPPLGPEAAPDSSSATEPLPQSPAS